MLIGVFSYRLDLCNVIALPADYFKPKDQNLNSHLLPLHVSKRSNGKKLLKYQANSLCDLVLNSRDHSVYKALEI